MDRGLLSRELRDRHTARQARCAQGRIGLEPRRLQISCCARRVLRQQSAAAPFRVARRVLRRQPKQLYRLPGRANASGALISRRGETKEGDTAGGNADIAAAKAIKPGIAAVSAGYGITIDAADPARIR